MIFNCNYRTVLVTLGVLIASLQLHSAEIEAVVTDRAPKAVGPYSQAIKAGPFLFISGQLAINPMKEGIVGKTIEAQTEQVLNNIEGILLSQGLTFANVVKTEVCLKSMDDFKGMNSVYAKKFSSGVKPARQAVQVAKLYLDALVEISCIAYMPAQE